MESKKILVPIDLTDLTPTVILVAKNMAVCTGFQLMLMHVRHLKSDPDVELDMRIVAEELNNSRLVKCTYVLRSGSIFSEIALEAAKPEYHFVLIGSHGFKGLREIMMGADILKLLKTIPLPIVTIQKGYVFPEKGFQTILLPVASHDTFQLIVQTTVWFAKTFDAKVHLYTVEKTDTIWTQKFIDNIQLAQSTFRKEAVNFVRVNEPESLFSMGYAKQILQYAGHIHADLFAMMSIPAREHFYFADGDKEKLLTNKALIPVVFARDSH